MAKLTLRKPLPKLGALTILVGAIGALGFAPFYLWPLTMLALAFLVWLIRQASSLKQALLAGFLFGLGHFLASLYWLPQAFWLESGDFIFAIVGGGLGLLALAGYCAVFPALATAVSYRLSQLWRADIALLSIFPVSWVTLEFLRAELAWGFPWNLLGTALVDSAPLRQLASVGDVWLLSGLLAFLGAAICFNLRIKIAATALLILATIYGYWQIWQPVPTSAASGKELLLVQGNVEELITWTEQDRWQQLLTYAELTLKAQAEREKSADLIVWPETVVMFDLQRQPDVRWTLSALLQPKQKLITGAPWREGKSIENSMLTLDSEGIVQSRYGKQNLVPFGEFVPLRKYLPNWWEIGRFVNQYQDYSPGTGRALLPINEEISALALICYEAIFPNYVRQNATASDFLLNITNDAWFAGTTAPHQHFAMARLRAVANQQALVRVANTGITALIGPKGEIIAQLPADTASVLRITLP